MNLAALSLVLGLGAGGLALAGSDSLPVATSWTDGPCVGGVGVTVVVQGDQTSQVRCAPGAFDSALDATQAAGFVTEFRPGFPGMVCVIDGLPDPCNGAPATAYWSYWQVKDGDWAYASVGAGADPAPVDTVFAWAYGSGQAPVAAPPVPAKATKAGSPSPMPATCLDESTSLCAGGTPWVTLGVVAICVVLVGVAILVVLRRQR